MQLDWHQTFFDASEPNVSDREQLAAGRGRVPKVVDAWGTGARKKAASVLDARFELVELVEQEPIGEPGEPVV